MSQQFCIVEEGTRYFDGASFGAKANRRLYSTLAEAARELQRLCDLSADPTKLLVYIIQDDPSERAKLDCIQDSCENAPFASVGGLEARANLQAPKWICEEDRAQYIAGYEAQALATYGEDWRTISFGWGHALTLA